jgi:threonine aldolase
MTMFKHSFFNDYSEGAHPALLEVLARTNFDQEDGYGNDALCAQAAELILARVANPQAQVHFSPGGTHANLIALASMLRPYESVIAAHTGHIAVHEAGAIEATGHKISTIPTSDGKLTPQQVLEKLAEHEDEHMVKPGVVFISNSSEVGTIYRKAELQALSQACRQAGLLLYLDGARLGCGLTAQDSDVSLADLGQLLDMFYIGGTKNGALIGEALVINTPALQDHFRFHLKQRGALLAKGRLMGSQFVGLFQNELYFELARHANACAMRLAQGIANLGYPFLSPPATNQIFPILPNPLVERMQQLYGFYTWQKLPDDQAAVRLVTSWATSPEKVDGFLADLVDATARGGFPSSKES